MVRISTERWLKGMECDAPSFCLQGTGKNRYFVEEKLVKLYKAMHAYKWKALL